ncbi:MAG: acyl-CoA desaturase, partial [Opitutia bacterium]
MPAQPAQPPANGLFRSLIRWFDADHIPEGVEALQNTPKKVDWPRSLPFVLMHLACFAVLWVGVSPIAVWTAVGLYFV